MTPRYPPYVAAGLAVSALLAGCQSTDPSAPTPATAEVLPPENGYVYVETESGRTHCTIAATDLGCEADFVDPPLVDGRPARGVHLSPDGQHQWVSYDLGLSRYAVLDYRTYSAEGWTIEATAAGTRFTNDESSHGMFVSVQSVDFF